MLKKGVPQRNIAQQLGVGIATVTRGAREIKMGRFKDVA
jgi:TrpR family trp operon transcriptional repressor